MSLLLLALISVCFLLLLTAIGLGVVVWRRNQTVTVPPFAAEARARTQPVRLSHRNTFHPILLLTPERALVIGAGSFLVAAFLGMAAIRGNSDLQILELEGYARLARLPHQIEQVDLNQHQSFSQYAAQIVSAQAGDFGPNACGLIAPAQAAVLSANPSLAGTPQGFNTVFTLMSQVRAKAVRADGRPAYTGPTGIQPGDLTRAIQSSPIGSQWQVTPRNGWTLAEMYQALLDGQIVIVDVQLNQTDEIPSTRPGTIAHFARVLGMDIDRKVIYIENTVDQRDGSYWTLPLAGFMQTWQYPETRASIKPSQMDPSIQEENVTRWALVMSRK